MKNRAMRKYLYGILIILSSLQVRAQTWFSLGSSWNMAAYALDTLNGTLYAAGNVHCSDSTMYCNEYIESWKGASWDTIDVIGGTFFGIISLCSYDNNFYFASTDGVFEQIGSSPNYIGAEGPDALLSYNGNLYAGGIFDTVKGTHANNIASWNGATWSALGSGIKGSVGSLGVYNGNVIAGGSFDSAGGIKAINVAVWNGSVWDSIGKGVNGEVDAIIVYNGNLYVGGSFDSAGGQASNNIAEWNGSAWQSLGLGINGQVNTLTTYNGKLIAGGYFDSAGGKAASDIVEWNGTTWDTVGFGKGVEGGGTVYAMTVYDGFLCVAGGFDTIDGTAVQNIAGWCIGCPAGVNEVTANNVNIKVYPNPSYGVFNFQLQMTNYAPCNVEVYNTLGQQVYNETLRAAQSDNQINLIGQPAGIYLYRVTSEKGEPLGSGKFVVVR